MKINTFPRCPTGERQDCRRREDQRQSRSLVGRKNTSPSLVFLFLASFIVGTTLLNNESSVLAEEGGALTDPDSAYNKCLDAISEMLSSDANLGDAHSKYVVSNALTEDEWTIGHSDDAVTDYQTACSKHSGAYWFGFDGTVQLVCDWPDKNIAGRIAEFYGVGTCTTGTEDCDTWGNGEAIMTMWTSIEGINCFDSNAGEAGDDMDESDSGEDGERLPFLTDEDVECMDATDAFIVGDNGLASAVMTFEDTQLLKEDNGVELMGYSEEAAKAMKSACELNKGLWAFQKSSKFECVIAGMETIEMHVHNFGSCLAKTDECTAMDTISLVRVDLAESGFNCWEIEDGGDSASASGKNSGATTDSSTEESESGGDAEVNGDASEMEEETSSSGGDDNGGDVEENGDISGTDEETNSAEVQNNDQEGDKDTDEDTDQDTTDVDDTDASDIFGGMGISDADQQCMDDSLTMGMAHPELQKAVEEYTASVEVENTNMADMSIGFSDENTDKLKTICNDSTVGGYFSLIEEQEFVCDMMSVEINLKITNIASCLANTDECRNMDPLLLMEDLWNSMGLTCKEQTADDKDDTTSSTTDTSQPDNSDNDKEEPNEDDSLNKALGLSESEVACMSESTTFVENSDVLENATAVFQKSVKMNDPTKLGYPTASASEMEQVCEEQGGIWSFVESDDVTCNIKGRDRCIHVYNFGNCIVNSNDCQSMDPFVLVKGFFLEVLGFSCKEKCDHHKETVGNPPSSAPHKNGNFGNSNTNNNSFSSQQNSGSTPGAGSKFPSLTTMAIVVGVVAAVGLAGFFRYRASHGRERVTRRQYEMTDISDLGFQVFT